MTSGIPPVDSSPTNAELATWLNDTLLPVLDDLLRTDNSLEDAEIRQRHLHPEVGGLFRLLVAHFDNGCNLLQECRLATIGNHGLSGLADIDGETPIAGDRILVRAQTDDTENGVYEAAAGAWARADDAATMADLGYAGVLVDGGDTLIGTDWICDAGVDGTIGTVSVLWKKLARPAIGPAGATGATGATGAPGADGDDGEIAPGSVGETELGDHEVTNDKLDNMTGPALKGRDTGIGPVLDLTPAQVMRSLAMCLPYGSAHQLSGTQPSSNDAPYVARTGCMYHIAQGNVAFKTNSRKGLVTSLTPSTLAGGSRGGAIYLGNTLHKVLFWGGAAGFILMDVDNDSFGSLVAPTGWGQLGAVYHAGSGYLYYNAGDKPRRCLLDGTDNSAGGSVTAAARLCLVGDILFVGDDTGAGASKVWKYDLGSWPTKGSAITLGGDTAYIGGLAALGSTYLLVGGYDGQILVVNPATLATVATITLSGVAARITEHMIYDATTDRIFACDNAGKVWVIDGTSYAVLGYCLPAGGVSIGIFASAGLTYDGDNGLLSVRVNATTEVHRFRA